MTHPAGLPAPCDCRLRRLAGLQRLHTPPHKPLVTPRMLLQLPRRMVYPTPTSSASTSRHWTTMTLVPTSHGPLHCLWAQQRRSAASIPAATARGSGIVTAPG